MLPMRVMAPPLGMSLAASRAQNQVPADQQWFHFEAKGRGVSRNRDGHEGRSLVQSDQGPRRLTHHVDVHELLHLLSGVLVGHKVLDDARGGDAGLWVISSGSCAEPESEPESEPDPTPSPTSSPAPSPPPTPLQIWQQRGVRVFGKRDQDTRIRRTGGPDGGAKPR